jgi:hypothetical protein
MGNSDKIILDLCGGTGSWSKPYRDAGYDVRLITLPEYDVFAYEPPGGGLWHTRSTNMHTLFIMPNKRKESQGLRKLYEISEKMPRNNLATAIHLD